MTFNEEKGEERYCDSQELMREIHQRNIRDKN